MESGDLRPDPMQALYRRSSLAARSKPRWSMRSRTHYVLANSGGFLGIMLALGVISDSLSLAAVLWLLAVVSVNAFLTGWVWYPRVRAKLERHRPRGR